MRETEGASAGGGVGRAGIGARAARALRLRCPHCGRGRVLESWFRMRERCPVCGIRTARGADDFMLGAMVFNIAFSEGLLAVGLAAVVLGTWPDVPWTFLQFGAPALMVLAPIAFLPFSRTLWMAFEPVYLPVTPEEAEEGRAWVRESAGPGAPE
ncbi:MAG TPA: DUF983 domain-containing protein [Longimicrobiaceae bacterium]|nr:DUF983 domain-containing protein [Longimicrobiaceae bacterium]